MKNLIIYIHPRKDFDDEGKVGIKIQIDNSLELGWKKEDIMLVTNFPYEYSGVKSLIVGDDLYCTFAPASSKAYTIPNLFEQKLIEKEEIYWVHDLDAFQNEAITQSEVEPEMAEMGITDDRGLQVSKLSMTSIFFKSSAEDIFKWIKDILYKYELSNEEHALWVLTGHDVFLDKAKNKLVKGYTESDMPEIKNINERIKKMNISYNFAGWNILSSCYEMAVKPIKVVHFHFSIDLELDSFMYGKNSLKKVLMPERLIKIFHKHGVKGVPFKKMKNLMIYFRRKELAHINPEKKFLGNTEDLVKRQIDNGLKLGWKRQDIVLITNFNYKYNGIKATVLDDSIFDNINDKAYKSNAIFHLLTKEIVKEAELWWYHDLDVLELRKIKSTEIDLEDTTAGFMGDGSGKLDTGSFFFRKDSDKIFEWMRNRTCRLRTDEKTAFMSLTEPNYRNINSMYKKLPKKLTKVFSKRSLKINL